MHLAADEAGLDAAALLARARARATSSRRGRARRRRDLRDRAPAPLRRGARACWSRSGGRQARHRRRRRPTARRCAAARGRRGCRCSPASSSTSCPAARPSCAAGRRRRAGTSCSARCTGSAASASTIPTTRSGRRSPSTTSGSATSTSSSRGGRARGLYDVMAHPDLAKVFGHRAPARTCASGSTPRRPRPSRRPAWRSRSRRRGCASPSASCTRRRPFLAACRRAGVPATLASDAHRPEDVGRDFDAAVAALHDGRLPRRSPLPRAASAREVPLG